MSKKMKELNEVAVKIAIEHFFNFNDEDVSAQFIYELICNTEGQSQMITEIMPNNIGVPEDFEYWNVSGMIEEIDVMIWSITQNFKGWTPKPEQQPCRCLVCDKTDEQIGNDDEHWIVRNDGIGVCARCVLRSPSEKLLDASSQDGNLTLWLSDGETWSDLAGGCVAKIKPAGIAQLCESDADLTDVHEHVRWKAQTSEMYAAYLTLGFINAVAINKHAEL